MIAIKLLMRMENKICGSVLILLKITVIFPLTSEGSETLAFFFFCCDRKEVCIADEMCHFVIYWKISLALQLCEQHVQLCSFVSGGCVGVFLLVLVFIVSEASVVLVMQKLIILIR